MKLKRHPVKTGDLVDEFNKSSHMFRDNIERGVIIQAAAALTDARRLELLQAIDGMVAVLGTMKRVVEATGQLVAQQRVSQQEEVAAIPQDD